MNFINILKMICRTHQLMNGGYQSFPENNILTIFSDPNYCYRCWNVAVIWKLMKLWNINFKLLILVPEEKKHLLLNIYLIIFCRYNRSEKSIILKKKDKLKFPLSKSEMSS